MAMASYGNAASRSTAQSAAEIAGRDEQQDDEHILELRQKPPPGGDGLLGCQLVRSVLGQPGARLFVAQPAPLIGPEPGDEFARLQPVRNTRLWRFARGVRHAQLLRRRSREARRFVRAPAVDSQSRRLLRTVEHRAALGGRVGQPFRKSADCRQRRRFAPRGSGEGPAGPGSGEAGNRAGTTRVRRRNMASPGAPAPRSPNATAAPVQPEFRTTVGDRRHLDTPGCRG